MSEQFVEKQPGGITGKGFQKGKSGNPGGRPKGALSITAELRKQLGEKAYGNQKRIEVFVDSLIKNGMKGNPAAIKEILSRIDGLVKPEDEGEKDSERRVIVDI